MLPALTNWPPNRLTPSIWGLESRPFLELPTPFLCAMTLYLDPGDPHRSHRLAVPAMPAVVLPTFELDDQDLGSLSLGHHLAGHPRGGQGLRLNRDVAVVVDEQHLVEFDRRPAFPVQALDLDHLAGGHAVLLPTRCDYRFDTHTRLLE